MVLVDSRVGSRELLATLRGFGVDADLADRLDADFQFTGNGEDGEVLAGIERKTIQDLLNSMRDRRLAGSQIKAMSKAYDIRYLIVEGYWRRGRSTGLVEILNGHWGASRGAHRYAEVDRFLCSLEELAGIRVWRTGDEEETCAAVADRYQWWQKPWSDHTSMRVVYAPEPERKRGRARLFSGETTLVEKWIAQLPGVDGRAIELAKYFASGLDLAEADVDRWMTITGLRIGEKTAKKIVGAITNSASGA
jgi:ERCC4-type nuclease